MRIVVVEDNPTNLLILSRLAGQVQSSEIVSYSDPRQAISFASEDGCDLVLVDYLMPELNGIEFTRLLRACPLTADVPAIMVTSEDDRAIRQAAIAAGATDFVTKPVEPIELKARVKNLLDLRRAALNERDRSARLAAAVADATFVIAQREKEMVMRMTRAIEIRDGGTGAHVERIALLSRGIGERLGLSQQALDELYLAAPMHDVGKIAVPDAILQKPGPLSIEERRVMQQHTVRGHAILKDSQAPLLQKAAEIALSHHERFDGSGYPCGLKGAAIPLEARIVAVADVYDALTSERPYKRCWSAENACDYLEAHAGSQFDPECVEAFLSRSDLHQDLHQDEPQPSHA